MDSKWFKAEDLVFRLRRQNHAKCQQFLPAQMPGFIFLQVLILGLLPFTAI